jgi:hypothetical protein
MSADLTVSFMYDVENRLVTRIKAIDNITGEVLMDDYVLVSEEMIARNQGSIAGIKAELIELAASQHAQGGPKITLLGTH